MKKTNLKECFIVRYADDFKIFCRKKKDAEKFFVAAEMWLEERLGLEISQEKSRVVNLKKQYSEFLGFKIRALPKGKTTKDKDKYVVSSFLSEKSKTKVKRELLQQIQYIQKPRNEKDEYLSVNIFNSMVIGMHNYYRMATNVNLDFQDIAFLVNRSLNYRLRERVKTKSELPQNGFVYKQYCKSRQMRYIKGRPLAAVGYVQHKSPMFKKAKINKYTPDGRALIHKNLMVVDTDILHYLMRNPIVNLSNTTTIG